LIVLIKLDGKLHNLYIEEATILPITSKNTILEINQAT